MPTHHSCPPPIRPLVGSSRLCSRAYTIESCKQSYTLIAATTIKRACRQDIPISLTLLIVNAINDRAYYIMMVLSTSLFDK